MKKHVIINLTLVSNILTSDQEHSFDRCEVEQSCLYPTAAFFEVETYEHDNQMSVESDLVFPLDEREHNRVIPAHYF